MFNSDELGDVIVMVQQVFYRSRFPGRNEISDAGDAHHSSFGRHLADRFISFASRLIGVERATIGMSNEHWYLGNFECIERGAVAAMSDINGHSYLINTFDDRNAEITDAIVPSLCASVADQVAAIICEQRYTLSELIKSIDVIWRPKMRGVLQSQNNANFSGTLRGIDACCAVYTHQVLPMMRNESIPQTEKPHHLVVRVWPGRSHADVHRVDPGIFETLKISSAKCFRIREPSWLLVSLDGRQHSKQREGVKHVHYCAALNQIDGAGRVFGRGLREELKPATVDHRCGQCRRSDPEKAFQGLTARYHGSGQYDNLCRHWQWRDA